MILEGIRTVYDSEAAYVPGSGGGAVALTPDAMRNFCSPDDARQIFDIAKQVLPQAQLIGGTGPFTATWNPGTYILTPGPDAIYANADTSGGRYMYRTPDGYRPMRIQSVSDGLDQFVAELVASYDGTKNGLTLTSTAQGKKLLWA